MTSSPLCISYDASSTVGPRTGVGIATAELLNQLVEVLPEQWSLRVFVNSPRFPIPNDAWASSRRMKLCAYRFSGKALLKSWQYLALPKIERFVEDVDLHHSPAGYPTPTKRALRVLNVHDLFFLKEARPDPYGGGYFAATYARRLADQHRIIVFSSQTGRELSETYRVDPSRIVVIPHGVNRQVFCGEPRPSDRDVTERWAEGRPYFLSVATAGPRKNLSLLVEAFALLLSRVDGVRPKLLLAGQSGSPETTKELDALIAMHHLGDDVVRTGYVESGHLPCLYRQALALVMPSLDEGFGLPILEAMACGCPVIAADRGSLPEVAGSAGILVNVDSPEPAAREMLRLFNSPELRKELRALGMKRSEEFTWSAAAKRTVDVYRGLAEEYR